MEQLSVVDSDEVSLFNKWIPFCTESSLIFTDLIPPSPSPSSDHVEVISYSRITARTLPQQSSISFQTRVVGRPFSASFSGQGPKGTKTIHSLVCDK
jgi:hypothetical protein